MKTNNPLLNMAGVEQTASMREKTLREQVETYLSRIRHTLPFPCTGEECYFGCMPSMIKTLYEAGVFAREPKPGREGNMLSTMYIPISTGVARGEIAHVSLNADNVFWFAAPLHAPLPRNTATTPFSLPDDHPFRDQIISWVRKAYQIEDELQESLRAVERYASVVKTAIQIKRTWPELLNFISFKNSGGLSRASNLVTPEIYNRLDGLIPQETREAVSLQLARAVMLPEKEDTPLQAWVQFYC